MNIKKRKFMACFLTLSLAISSLTACNETKVTGPMVIVDEVDEIDDIIRESRKKQAKEDKIKKSLMLFITSENAKDEMNNINKNPEIERLNIVFSPASYIPDSIFNNIDANNLKDLKEIYINNYYMNLDKNYSFLRDLKSLEKLELANIYEIDYRFLETLTNIKDLTLSVKATTYIDYRKLSFLKTLKFENTKPYDLAIYLDTKDVKYLEKKGVEVIIPEKEKFEEANKKIHRMMKRMELLNKERRMYNLNEIVNFIMNKYTYSDNVIKSTLFYEDGMLEEALKSNEIICGNYASLAAAFLNRVGIETTIVHNDNHAWNLLSFTKNDLEFISSLDTGYAYLDITQEDSDIENNLKNDWYMTNPLEDHVHVAVNFPKYIKQKKYDDLKREVPYIYKNNEINELILK